MLIQVQCRWQQQTREPYERKIKGKEYQKKRVLRTINSAITAPERL